MKQFISVFSLTVLLGAAVISCKKDNDTIDSPTKQALTAHTWQMETVTDYQGATFTVIYQRGAANNEEDFSLVRQTYKRNGSIQWTDEFGNSGSNGTYTLMENDTKIRIGISGSSIAVVGENLKVTATEYAYTLKHSATDSTRYIFSPL